MRTLLFYFLCFWSINSYSQNTYTPEKGSKERKEILDVLRNDYYQQTLFKVEHFKINGKWAAVRVTPLKNNEEVNDGFWGLFNKVSEEWKELDWSEGIDFQDDFELIDLPTQNGRIAKLIVKKYPTCSMTIFGK
ncbi:hypothetical protein OAA13_00120 [Crocinitomicaceae bacterium]|nr:hypothetical protein [Crocinitomicaceae bacterium]MDC3308917.1 hypothetical protein [Crocinitomicaceae bacterium]